MSAQMKYQKIIAILSIIAAAVFFVFGLGFSTNLYSLYYFIDPSNIWYVPGSELYYTVQPFNHTEVNLAIVLIVMAAIQFLTMNHSRRKYYISNYITSIAYAGFALYISNYVYQNCVTFREQFLTQVDFAAWQTWVTMFQGLSFNDSTFWFDAGIVVAVIGVVCSILTIINLIWKTINMSREKRALCEYKEMLASGQASVQKFDQFAMAKNGD